MDSPHHINQLVDHLFRHESGKMLAVLSRLLGLQNLEPAQDIVQDTLLQAMNTWSFKGIPENPAAWLYRVAQNKAIDWLRREQYLRKAGPQYAHLLGSNDSTELTETHLFLEHEIQDSQLRMIFACCHPAIPEDAQIAFVLKTLCGLSVSEIAKAYLVGEDTIAKRIYRAKEKIRLDHIELEVPMGEELSHRLNSVLKSLYLLFNEGYSSSNPDLLVRDDLCREALRLCYILAEHPLTKFPRTRALLALFCFQASRFATRLDETGRIVLIKFQDRTKWDRELIRLGFYYIDVATDGQEISKYHFEAAIASIHAAASSFETTDWKSIYHLYDTLYGLEPSPIIALNKAIASAYAISRENALRELSTIKGLENYYLYHASAGEIYFDLDKKEQAKSCFQKAFSLTASSSEQQLLLEKISRCSVNDER
jgi:RNA polymerase sigma factor (sigma-70 family)